MPSQKALLVIDIQMDYFPEGKMPLWNTQQVLVNIEHAIALAKQQNMEVLLIQHKADPALGASSFFNENTSGVEIHPQIIAIDNVNEIIVKRYADSFEATTLDHILNSKVINSLLLCGMMTQNCITHTALSKAAEKYDISILQDCCTTVDETIHKIALRALSTRIPLVTLANGFS